MDRKDALIGKMSCKSSEVGDQVDQEKQGETYPEDRQCSRIERKTFDKSVRDLLAYSCESL
jgi:hypothetical protein